MNRTLALLLLLGAPVLAGAQEQSPYTLVNQPTIFWRGGEWQIFRDGRWLPYTSPSRNFPEEAVEPVATPEPDYNIPTNDFGFNYSGGAGLVTGPHQRFLHRGGHARLDHRMRREGLGPPNSALGQPNTGLGQPNVAIGPPTVGMGPPNTGIGRTTIGIGQPNFSIGPPNIGIGPPNLGIGQPNTGIGPTTIGIGQPAVGLGKANTGIGRPTVHAPAEHSSARLSRRPPVQRKSSGSHTN